jgi:hypothetical protein
MGKNSLVAQFL